MRYVKGNAFGIPEAYVTIIKREDGKNE